MSSLISLSDDTRRAQIDYEKDTIFVTTERSEREIRDDIRHELAHQHLHKEKRLQELSKRDAIEEKFRREIQVEQFMEGKVSANELFSVIAGVVMETNKSKSKVFAALDRVAKEEKVSPEIVKDSKLLFDIWIKQYLEEGGNSK